MRPIDIKIQNTAVREGIVEAPVICWKFSERDAGKRQAACRILLKRPDGGCLYDTGTLETGKQNGHRLELSFQTHIRFFAEVEITDTEGKTESGRSGIYVSGIAPEKTPEKNWIGNGTGDPFYALRFLEPGKKLKNAYCSAAATGQYELRINGKLPDDSVLNGSWTDFHKRIHYRTFEVTALLKEGRNCLSMEAGNGWYYGKCKDGRYFYTMDKGYEAFGDKLGVNVFLTLEYEDGTREEVVRRTLTAEKRTPTGCFYRKRKKSWRRLHFWKTVRSLGRWSLCFMLRLKLSGLMKGNRWQWSRTEA